MDFLQYLLVMVNATRQQSVNQVVVFEKNVNYLNKSE